MASESLEIRANPRGDVHGWIHTWVSEVWSRRLELLIPFGFRLGDRHGENILFDSVTGDTVHVDFNCIFDKVR